MCERERARESARLKYQGLGLAHRFFHTERVRARKRERERKKEREREGERERRFNPLVHTMGYTEMFLPNSRNINRMHLSMSLPLCLR